MAFRRVAAGSCHQGELRSNYAGFQCTVIAYMALVTAFLGNDNWNTSTIDQLIYDGHNLYVDTLLASGNATGRYLGHWEVPRTVEIQDSLIHGHVYTDIFHGIVGEPDNPVFQSVSIADAIRNAGVVSNFILATFSGSSVAIYHDDNGHWFLFDSHARSATGQIAFNGVGSLFAFDSEQECIDFLVEQYFAFQFNFSPIVFEVNPMVSASQTSVVQQRNLYETSTNSDFSNRLHMQSRGKPGTSVQTKQKKNQIVCNKTTTGKPMDIEAPQISHENAKGKCDQQRPSLESGTSVKTKQKKQQIVSNKTTTGKPMDIEAPQTISHENAKGKCDKQKRSLESGTSVKTKQKKQQIVSNKTTSGKPMDIETPKTISHENAKGKCDKQRPSLESGTSVKTKQKKQHIDHSYAKSKKSLTGTEQIWLSQSQQRVSSTELTNQRTHCMLESSLRKCAMNYEMEIRSQIAAYCKCCHKFLFNDQLKNVNLSRCMTDLLQLSSNTHTFCRACTLKLRQDVMPGRCFRNNLDAGSIPECLKQLNTAEKRLISQLQSFMTLLVLPGGQYAEKGLSIHFPMQLDSYFTQLRNLPQDQIIVLNPREAEQSLQPVNLHSLADLNKVKVALMWFKHNNPLYEHYQYDYGEHVNNDCDESDFIRNALQDVPQSTVVNTDYSLPEVNLANITNSNVIKLPIQFDKPVWISDIPNGEELSFPWLYPYGKNGINEKRDTPLTTLKYFQTRLFNNDPRWRKDITFLMFAVNHYEQQTLIREIGIHMRKRQSASGNSALLTNANISTMTDNPDLTKNSYMFMKNIRGTAAYWADTLHNLLAMVKSLGAPTLFVTLSADDNHWPELTMLLKSCSYNDALTFHSCAGEMKQDPLLTSIHFEKRWNAFYKHILNGNDKPLGNILDHFGRVEYQNRGSPHMHLFLWIEGAPKLHENTAAEIEMFIDSILSTTIPNNDDLLADLVKRLQTHHHTSSCMRNHICRFGFPKDACEQTKILANVNISSPHNRGKFYVTERSQTDTFIKAYNGYLLKRWRANMDVQVVSGSHSLAYYVCAYVSKHEPQDLKNALSEVISNIMTTPGQINLRKQLMQIGNCVLKTRRLSAQEACARLCGLKLTYSSRTVVYVNARPENERFKVLKTFEQRSQLPDNSTDIFHMNIIDYYHDRPDALEDKSLFYFASWYCKASESEKDCGSRSQPRIHLKNHDIVLRKRSKSCIIRTPKLSHNNDAFYFSLLLLHVPHRLEIELIVPYNTVKLAFLNKYNHINVSDIQYDSFVNDIERSVQQIRISLDDIGTLVAPNTHENVTGEPDISSEHECLNASRLNTNPPMESNEECSDMPVPHADLHLNSFSVHSMANEDLYQRINSFNDEQKMLFTTIRNHFENENSDILKMFISGGAGTGKSFLLQTIVAWIRNFSSHQSNPSNMDSVLVCGPTGMSAKNVGGKTLHSVFRLPVQHGKEPQYKELSSKMLQLLFPYFRNIHTLIIDEISMVSSTMLTFIHRRLVSLKKKDEFFGGINVILIGDFYQLRPVRGTFAFTNHILWNLFQPYILKENMRQKGDAIYRELLNRARVGNINEDDVKLLKSRLILNNDQQFDGVLRVFPKCNMVNQHNNCIQQSMERLVVSIEAVHQFSNSGFHHKSQNVEDLIPQDDRDAGGLPRILRISIGTRVMLIRNIATDHGLVNGALGSVTHITCDSNGPPTSVFVKFDDSSIGRLYYSQEHDAIEITKIRQEFFYEGHSIVRTQFPLHPAWACTIHKIQGCTCKRIVVDIGSDIFASGQAYVALSRVTSLEGLALLSLDPHKIRADAKVTEFYTKCSEK